VIGSNQIDQGANGDIGNVTILNENSYIVMPKGTDIENLKDDEGYTDNEESQTYKSMKTQKAKGGQNLRDGRGGQE
jgi:hypothetical protein